ncbi:methyl-accepting chemotaxis protein [Marinospirillum alkaliphilum]|uniref:Methyl-accepting chemotaxis protein (MCP) signalling domain-containing protein n=1 Tax=Marinospirillum alkaliphilum DSM 21637 TaxID=1122209 RepID=A0A1K1WUL6_9GAMM|nr:methyl-accepting chemotaxis protein [Marinospirillum alkaliphilum]SFX40660.1 Methyl-accepting chemotaxis protein (MCP) signalling domain-containing protein [Marinospirillum alkaliphilum DSM 21637]
MYRAMLKSHTSKGSPFLSGKFLITCVIFNLLVIVTALVALLTHHWLWVVLPPVMALVFTLYAWRYSRKPLITLSLIDDALRRARIGEMHHRITHTQGLGEVGRVSWDLNDFLDLIESYFKEVNSAFAAVGRGDFSRKALSKGMPGEFARSLGSINQSIDAMQANKAFTEQNRLSSQLHELNTDNLKDNLQLTQKDLKNISHTMNGIAHAAEQNAENATQSQKSAEAMAGLLQKISASVTLVGETVAALNRQSQAVSGTLQAITDISDQTSLLALNASIEAARAGEQGRGFAVVADEVKQLSHKTKEAAQSINTTLLGFSRQVGQSLDGAQESQQLAEQIQQEIKGFQQRFAEVAEDAHQTLKQVELVKDISFASLLKVDHVISKQQAYDGLNSTGDECSQTASEQLELWLEKNATTELGRMPVFQQLQQSYHNLQDQLQQALSLYQQSSVASREQIVALMQQAEASSGQLLGSIDQIVEARQR